MKWTLWTCNYFRILEKKCLLEFCQPDPFCKRKPSSHSMSAAEDTRVASSVITIINIKHLYLLKAACRACEADLDRVGGHVAHEAGAVGIVQHGHHGEGVPQQAVELLDVLRRRRRLAESKFWLDATVIWHQQNNTPLFQIMACFVTNKAVHCVGSWEEFTL